MPKLTYVTLEACCRQYAATDPNYEKWQDPASKKQGFFLTYKGQRWCFTKKPSQACPLSIVVTRLLTEEAISTKVPNLPVFVRRLNALFHQKIVVQHKLKGEGEKVVLFKHKSPDYTWLSNLFFSFVWLDPGRVKRTFPADRIHPCSELAYQTWKFNSEEPFGTILQRLRAWQPPKNAADEKALCKFLYDIGFKARMIAASQEKLLRDNYPRPDQRIKRIFMCKVQQAKFTQNEVLHFALCQTGRQLLVEDTNSSFWGAGKPPESSLHFACTLYTNLLGQLQQQKKAGVPEEEYHYHRHLLEVYIRKALFLGKAQNVLGEVIMRVRDELLQRPLVVEAAEAPFKPWAVIVSAQLQNALALAKPSMEPAEYALQEQYAQEWQTQLERE